MFELKMTHFQQHDFVDEMLICLVYLQKNYFSSRRRSTTQKHSFIIGIFPSPTHGKPSSPIKVCLPSKNYCVKPPPKTTPWLAIGCARAVGEN